MSRENNLRIPATAGHIQVNFCKNPSCKNFGIPASQERQPRGHCAAERGRDSYTVVSGKGRNTVMLRCKLCGDIQL